jgi:integrase
MKHGRLTAFKVDSVKPNKTKRIEIPDAGKPGLYLVVQPNGRKSWAVRYRSPIDRKPRKFTLDGFPSLAAAHKLAQGALDKVAEGRDPAVEKQVVKRAPASTSGIDAAFRLFLDKHIRTRGGKPIRESTKAETARILGYRRGPDGWEPTGKGVLSHWKGRNLQSIKPFEVRDMLEDVANKGPVLANRTLTALKTCFRFHLRRDPDLLLKSPCEGIENPSPETSRRRKLSDTELAALWSILDTEAYPFGRMVQLLILTGCRRDEVRQAPWTEFDFAHREWLIPDRRTKNGRDHLVPITDLMASILDGLPRIKGPAKLLFTTNGRTPVSGVAKFKERIDLKMAKALGEDPEPWTLHDLRRTFVSGLQRLRFPIDVAEACVNHASGTVSGITEVYARHAYEVEKREALDAWARHVMAILDDRPGDNVVPMTRGR